MARKEKPLTALQVEALVLAEETLYGDTKLIAGYGRQTRGLKSRGLVEGDMPHVYLSDAGKTELAKHINASA